MSLLDFHILNYDSLPSTNTEASAQARRGARQGLVVVAQEQTAGRGRHSRAWASPAGAGLYMSIILRPQLHRAEFPLLTFLAALAIKEALLRTAKLETDIKWSNDLLAGARKISGVLAEAIETHTGLAVILGIGVNLRAVDMPPEISRRATSVEAETGILLNPDALLRGVLAALRPRYDDLHSTNGAVRLIEDYSRNSSYAAGKSVRVEVGDNNFVGVTCGLAPDGALRVELPDGEIKIVHAGDITALRSVHA